MRIYSGDKNKNIDCLEIVINNKEEIEDLYFMFNDLANNDYDYDKFIIDSQLDFNEYQDADGLWHAEIDIQAGIYTNKNLKQFPESSQRLIKEDK